MAKEQEKAGGEGRSGEEGGSWWERFWFGPIHPLRPFLVLRVTMLILAFDVWLLNLERSARYGAGGFNVAHFGWLEAIQPLPTPDLYASLMAGTGVCALLVALGAKGWLLRLAVFAFYTYGWMMSMTDSYQHHYLLSLVLLLLVFFPEVSSREVLLVPEGGKGKKPEGGGKDAAGDQVLLSKRISGWAYVLLGVAAGFVYFFTAITKTDGDWRQGSVVQHLFGNLEPMASIHKVASGWGISEVSFWNAMGLGVIAMQVVAWLGYLGVVRPLEFEGGGRRGEGRKGGWRSKRWLRWLYLGGLGLACALIVGFHGYIEIAKRLDIGWFSYYMIGFAVFYFFPAVVLLWVARILALPGWALSGLWERVFPRGRGEERAGGREEGAFGGAEAAGWAAILLGLGGLGWLFVKFGETIDLPGAKAIVVGGFVVGIGGAGTALWRGGKAEVWGWLGRVGLVFGVMWYTLTAYPVRYEMYRYWGGDLRRRGEVERSICAYEKAGFYAPLTWPLEKLIAQGYVSRSVGSLEEAHRRLRREAVLESLRRQASSSQGRGPFAFPCTAKAK